MRKALSSISVLTLGAVLAATLAAGPLAAQTKPVAVQPVEPPAIEWDKKRLERLEKNVRKMEKALGQYNEQGEPFVIQPDPEVVALQGQVASLTGKVADLEEALQRVNGQLESSNFELTKARQAQNASAAQIDPLLARIAALETKMATMDTAAASAPAKSTGSSASDFKAAKQMMLEGDYAAAEKAFEAFVEAWSDSPETAEAWYNLGEIRFTGSDREATAVAYAYALKGWPKTKWAPEAAVKFSTALAGAGRNKEACSALAEYNKRYAEGASAALKTRAAAAKTKAKCV
ncbi:tetratricopeptide repeat protein [Caulobacter sp. 17J80-11]|uniref:tetratricopeptide repeat protein n=1 Tax=Caulobacter sp. 17J80-11 TaxID=2763502 RepID=UPI001653C133|nr:tetratricopeptide repeat protein [Caulobacter sp. 17J80-11]MBC6980303.1 tetratricopeptide repeat protein [Caulobacter sp. 17J80-11]